MVEFVPLLMFLVICVCLLAGYPVAFTLSGVAMAFAGVGVLTGHFDMAYLHALPNRLFGTMVNVTLIAIPLFIFMGVMLEKSRLAEDLLDNMTRLCGSLKGGLGISVVLVGALLAASTGIVGATVVTMGLISLPSMMKRGYPPALASGAICATGTLGQIIPPSIVLVLLGDILSTAYQQAQLRMGIFIPDTMSIGDLFVGAIIPGLALVLMYVIYIYVYAAMKPDKVPSEPPRDKDSPRASILVPLLPPVALIFAVLGSIIFGAATPTEAAGVGAIGATLLALVKRQLNLARLKEVMSSTTQITAMVFMILVGAIVFSLVFRGFGGEELVSDLLSMVPGGTVGAVLAVMLAIFILGFILDFIEITFVVVPIVAPALLAMGVDPIWLGIMIAVNLQTSFLTPPFGFALFYLRGVAPASVLTTDIYKGVMPFILLQLAMLVVLFLWPELTTWLPNKLLG